METAERKMIYTAIDLQEKLVPAMYEREELIENTVRLITGLNIIGVPGFATTQYEKGLGSVVGDITGALGYEEHIDKNTFSIMGCSEFVEKFTPAAEGRDVILFGIETHICLMQSALDMLEREYRVYIPADCVSSRKKYDKDMALKRLANAGCIVTTSEALLFEIIRGAKHPAFKEISKLVK